MANENDDSQHYHRDSNQLVTTSIACKDENVVTEESAVATTTTAEADEPKLTQQQEQQQQNCVEQTQHDSETVESTVLPAADGAKGKLNDLVADLYASTLSNGAPEAGAYSGYGDYKNIRATSVSCNLNNQIATSSITTTTATSLATTAPATQHPPQNTFSFKHFLSNSSSSAMHAPSSIVTSLNVTTTTGAAATSITTNTTNSCTLQSSTGARPKVPQSSSFSLSGAGSTSNESAAQNCTKMKRSPRFSSFDSRESLTGTADGAATNEEDAGNCSGGGFRMHTFANSGASAGSAAAAAQYDMQLPSATPRRRLETSLEARPNRLSLAPSAATAVTKQRVRLEAHCFPGELPSDGGGSVARATAADFPAAAAALPDFVQDHWLDSWYASEMHLNSPPNSPICDFVQDLPGGGGNGASSTACSVGAAAAVASSTSASTASEAPAQRLPDFLSDGPIIHSSQRLADVAAGLPTNINSESDADVALKQQLSQLRIENECQRRELSEARNALSEQKRRCSELEHQMLELQRAAHKRNTAAEKASLQASKEEHVTLEQTKRRQALSQAHVRKLKQQVKQLMTEIDCLRRENELLHREDGAVGGCGINAGGNCDRQCSSRGAAASAGRAGVSTGAMGNAIRPSRTQQISRDLLRAATTAENNLRQLLSGVDNLRQMAANIEESEVRLDYDASLDLFSDFMDECESFEEHSGGPAL